MILLGATVVPALLQVYSDNLGTEIAQRAAVLLLSNGSVLAPDSTGYFHYPTNGIEQVNGKPVFEVFDTSTQFVEVFPNLLAGIVHYDLMCTARITAPNNQQWSAADAELVRQVYLSALVAVLLGDQNALVTESSRVVEYASILNAEALLDRDESGIPVRARANLYIVVRCHESEA